MKIKFDNAKEVFSVVLAGDICPGGNGGKVCNPDYASVLAPVRDFIREYGVISTKDSSDDIF